MLEANTKCIYCGASKDVVPLIQFQYRDMDRWICPQHLPILIHQPQKLADKLPGVDYDASECEHGHHD
jgi:hypothetical protein